MKKHSCKVYFRIAGRFDPDFVSCVLGLTPYRVRRCGDVLPISNIVVDEDDMDICYNDVYNVDLNEMLRVSLKPLMNKVELLKTIRAELGVEYYVVLVPRIDLDSDDPTPVLSLDNDIMEFMCKIGAKHDLDYYIY